jgi:D-threo-aldose 1-dehydrogenase
VVSTVVGARGTDQVTSFLDAARTPVPVELWAELREAWLLDPMAPVPHASLPDISI